MKKIFRVKNNEDLRYPIYYKPQILLKSLNDMVNAINYYLQQMYLYKNIPIPKIRLWCSGSSGIAVASLIASRINIENIIYIPKNNEKNHRHFTAARVHYGSEYFLDAFVDDFMDEGTTCLRVLDAAKKYLNKIDTIWCFGAVIEVSCIDTYIGREFKKMNDVKLKIEYDWTLPTIVDQPNIIK